MFVMPAAVTASACKRAVDKVAQNTTAQALYASTDTDFILDMEV